MGLQLPDHRFKSGCRLQHRRSVLKRNRALSFVHEGHASPRPFPSKSRRQKGPPPPASGSIGLDGPAAQKFPALSEDKTGRIEKTKGHASPRPFSSKPGRQKGPPPSTFGSIGLAGPAAQKFPALSEDKTGRIEKTKGHASPRPFSSKPGRQKGPPPPAFGRIGLDGSETKMFYPARFSDEVELGLRKSHSVRE